MVTSEAGALGSARWRIGVSSAGGALGFVSSPLILIGECRLKEGQRGRKFSRFAIAVGVGGSDLGEDLGDLHGRREP